MAIRFMLFVECADAATAEACRAHFDGFEIELLSGKTTRWHASNSDFSSPAIEVISFDLGSYGVVGLQDAVDSTFAGLSLLSHLKAGPEFLFARVGVEVGNVRANELSEWVEEYTETDKQQRLLRIECVLHESLYQSLGRPDGFTPFRPGYVWRKYYGERYRPLYALDQPELNAKCRAMFPEYFRY